MRICTVEGCGKKYDSIGYCKSHYRSFLRYGNPIQVDLNNAARREEALRRKELEKEGHQLTLRGTKRWAQSTDGICTVDGCENPIKARRLCDMHYARQLRNGTTEVSTRRMSRKTDVCLAIGCDRPHVSAGFCSTHKSYNQKFGTPYLANTIKLCGVPFCTELHWGKGLCREHFLEWKKIEREYFDK